MSRRSIAVVSGGLGEPSSSRMLADLLAGTTREALADQDLEAEFEFVELKAHARDLANQTVTSVGSPALTQALDRVAGSDGLIAVTPVFSASYSGLFKMFFDVLEPGALERKPVLIAATAGTPRHALVLDHALRPLFSYLGAVVVPTGVFAATEDWGGGSDRALTERAARAGRELAELVARTEAKPSDPFQDFPSFDRLLDGSAALAPQPGDEVGEP